MRTPASSKERRRSQRIVSQNKSLETRLRALSLSMNQSASEAQGTMPNIMQGLTPNNTTTHRLAVVNAQEIVKLKGLRRDIDVIWTPGPSISSFLSSVNAYCSANGISKDEDKKMILKLNIDQTQGDANACLQRYWNPKSHDAELSYDEICARLLQVYQLPEEVNFASAARNFFQWDLDYTNIYGPGNIMSLEEASWSLVDRFLARNKYKEAPDTRPTASIMAEFAISLGIARRYGEKIAAATIDTHPGNTPTVTLGEKVLAHLRRNPTDVPKREQVNAARHDAQKDKFQTNYNNSNHTPNSGNKEKKKWPCSRCGKLGHHRRECRTPSENLFCNKCKEKGDHATNVCETVQKFRQRREKAKQGGENRV